jgi:hypothetical protein
MKAELVPANGDSPIPITRDLTVVGRREFCDVQIDHESLSKRHCVIVRTDGLLMVRDLASTNGTKVNGQKVLWAALLPNDRLALGRYKFRVYLGPDDLPGPSEGGGGKAASGTSSHERPSPVARASEPSPTTMGLPIPSPATVGFVAPTPLGTPAAPPRPPAAPARPPAGRSPAAPDSSVVEAVDLVLDDDSDDEPVMIELD